MVNRGKDFEVHFKTLVENEIGLSADTQIELSIDRFYDNMGGFKGITYPSDFIAYKFPFNYYFELKTTSAKSLPLSHISNSQFNKMLDKSKCLGTYAGVVVWYYNYRKTIYIPIQSIKMLVEGDNKSFSIDTLIKQCIPFIEITGRQKRLYCDYNIMEFFKNLENFHNKMFGWGVTYNVLNNIKKEGM